ncbi:hypothetical protein [Methylococcus mesophilus]|uniref:hypothetical protein n=1 Tax=Methylococcus mesophilus TaxID=2993564 RepID=UPI00224B9C3E|nr:hypothetical protein [Methylococcus mesophilus]UZR27472.1 hypothetical protein OOT43_12080 [Methylococcus mesophilus]
MSQTTPQPIESLKPGRFTAMSGQVVEFSESDLAAMAAAYDPAVYRAPIVAGHPKHDDPAYGWVDALRYSPDTQRLLSVPGDVDPAFAEMVRSKKFRSVSLSVYLPDSPANPKPGVFYPRHLGFLGAMPPAVKGLREASLSDSEEGVIELSEWDDVTNAGLWRRLREWLIGQFGQDTADRVIPGYDVQSLEQAAQQEVAEAAAEDAGAQPAFSESQPEVTPTMTAQTTDLAEREAEIARREAELQRREAAATRQAHADFAESLVQAGKLPPADKAGLVEFMASLDGEATLEFSEGEETVTTQSSAWLKSFLSRRLPKTIEFSELSGGAGTGDEISLSEDERKTCEALNLTAEEYLAAKKGA